MIIAFLSTLGVSVARPLPRLLGLYSLLGASLLGCDDSPLTLGGAAGALGGVGGDDAGVNSAGGATGGGTAGTPGSAGVTAGSNAGSAGMDSLPLVAANGVPIPRLEAQPAEPCGVLEIVTVPCDSDECHAVECDCGDRTVPFIGDCILGHCLSSLSCDAVCASPAPDPMATASACLVFGTCADDTDCDPNNSRCVKAPGYARGQCGDGRLCYEPADCLSNSCAVIVDGSGMCTTGAMGAHCNIDAHCAPDNVCQLTEGLHVGQCVRGENAEDSATPFN